MPQPPTVTRSAARRALLAHLGLLRARTPRGDVVPWRDELHGPEGAREALRRLQAVQVDPVAAVERNHHLVLFARVGGYRAEHLEDPFPRGLAFEYLANARCILPVEALPDFAPSMLQARANAARAEDPVRQAMAALREHARTRGPVVPRAVGNDGPRLMGVGFDPVDVASKASGRAIDLLWLGGELVVAGRRGNEKVYDLPERVLGPPWARLLAGPPPPPAPGAPVRPWSAPTVVSPETCGPAWGPALLRRYLAAFGLADAGDPRFGWRRLPASRRRAVAEELAAAGELVPLRVEGVRRTYFAVPALADASREADAWPVAPEARLLPPLDPLLWRRQRVADLFGFHYTWEVYLPESRRRFGYYAMPLLYGDRLIARVDPRLDRARGRLALRLVALEEGVAPDGDLPGALAAELVRFAAFHGARALELGEVCGDARQRGAVTAAVARAAGSLA